MNINSLLSAYSAAQSVFTDSNKRTNTTPAAETKTQGSFADVFAAAKSPGKQLEEYLAMSDGERYQQTWLSKRGLTKEQFDALPAEEKQKLTEQMQQDMKQEMQAKLDAAKEKNKLAINLLS
jgi:predicted flavoprotein YhiN